MSSSYAFIVAPDQKWVLPLGGGFDPGLPGGLTSKTYDRFSGVVLFEFDSTAKLYLWNQFRLISIDNGMAVLCMNIVDEWLNRLSPNRVYIAFGESTDRSLPGTGGFTRLEDVLSLRREASNYNVVATYINIMALPGAIALPLVGLLILILPEIDLTLAAYKYLFFPAYFIGLIPEKVLSMHHIPLWLYPAYYSAWFGLLKAARSNYISR